MSASGPSGPLVSLPINLNTGFPRALENLENHKKSSMHGKIMEFEKKLKNYEKSWNFVK